MQRRDALLFALGGSLCIWALDTNRRLVTDPIDHHRSPDLDQPAQRVTAVTVHTGGALARSGLWDVSERDVPRYPLEVPERPYVADRLMVQLADGVALQALAREHGARMTRLPGPSGYGELTYAPGTVLGPERSALLDDPRVLDAGRIGVMHGCSATLPVSWQVNATKADEVPRATDYSGVVVAVLDTGVAYEDYSDEQDTYVQVAGMAGVGIVAPWDFVNDDAHANDDHQHGTHIACAIACTGAVQGYAPGASIMPLKVLDHDNSGTETALVDAIWHAVDNDADVINMSLSFSLGYLPSIALADALNAAHDAGIALLAASGNDGAFNATYPAAHPRVFAVGATALKGDNDQQEVGYSNRDPAVDIVAPGGNLDADDNGDGYPDGILAETISFQDPSSTGYWFYAGTSQATAGASGAAAWLVEQGASRDQIYTALQLGASSLGSEIEDGYGTGKMRLKETLDQLDSGAAGAVPERYVAVMPYIKDYDDELETTALVTVLDGEGGPVSGVEAWVYFVDQDGVGDAQKCGTDGDGRCTVGIDKVDKYDDATGEEIARAWAISVPTISEDHTSTHPGSAFFATDALEILLAAMDLDGSGLATSPLGFKWDRDVDYADMDAVADAYVFMNLGTGLATSPLGVIATPPMIEPHASIEHVDLDLDGTGLATSPLGVVTICRMTLGGTGLATSPLGLTQFTILPLGGVGLATSPLGFTPPTMLDPLASSYDSPLLDLRADPVLLGTGLATSPLGFEGTVIGEQLDAGGWMLAEGYGAGTALMGSGLASFEMGESVTARAGAGSEPLE